MAVAIAAIGSVTPAVAEAGDGRSAVLAVDRDPVAGIGARHPGWHRIETPRGARTATVDTGSVNADDVGTAPRVPPVRRKARTGRGTTKRQGSRESPSTAKSPVGATTSSGNADLTAPAAAGSTSVPWSLLLVPAALLAGVAIGRRRPPSRAMMSNWMTWATTPTVPHLFQNEGEALLSQTMLRHFGAPDWHLLNHVTLPMDDGTTQVDHILVSRFGVFVIETKHHRGCIVGEATNPEWTQHAGTARHTFQNPIHQNYRHLCAVRELLHFVPPHFVHSLVVFTGEATFSPAPPRGVYRLPEAVEHLRTQRREVLSLEELQFCVGILETSRFAITRETDIQHVATLERRFGAA